MSHFVETLPSLIPYFFFFFFLFFEDAPFFMVGKDVWIRQKDGLWRVEPKEPPSENLV